MLAVQVELLTGRYVATQFNNRNRVEWPPHPARLFSAAVAAWADTDDPDPAEREALLWWEAQGHPQIACSWGDEWSERAAVTHFVPVNDTQVVARDTSETYRRLRSASDEARTARSAGGAEATTKALVKLDKQVAKLQTKATEDSMKAAAGGDAPASALAILPEARVRQARVYPTAIPADDRVVYLWPEAAEDPHHRAVLDQLLARVPRLGHSSSYVDVSLTDSAPPPVLVPQDRGWIGIRVASEGQLDALELAFASHQGNEPRTLPAEIATYAEATPQRAAVERSVLGSDWITLDLGHTQRLTVRDTLATSKAVRGALMRWSVLQPAPEIITGHRPGAHGERTDPSEGPHLAIVPLPFVGHSKADGLLQAVTLVIPDSASPQERQHVLQAAGRWLTEGKGSLRLGERGRVTVSRLDPDGAPWSAQVSRWNRPARRWLTATPIALDRNPGPLTHPDPGRRDAAIEAAEASIRAACSNIGLPEPAAVNIQSAAPVAGTRPAPAFPPYAVQGGRLRRVLVHAEIVFHQPVGGTVLLGAGRYLGYGLCLPANSPTESTDA